MDLTMAVYQGLDPDNDDHWSIEKGLPSRSQLAKLTSNPDITREEVEEVAPGYRRKDALAAKAAFQKADPERAN